MKVSVNERLMKKRDSLKLAVVRYEAGGSHAMDARLTALAHHLRRADYSLAGAVQSNPPIAGRSRCDMILEDLASGAVMRVSEDRGALAQGCRLDTAALEEFAGYVLDSLGPHTDIAIVNRFGKREAEGRGLRSVIEAAVLEGIPVLVGVSAFHWPAWQAFAGNCAALIPADEAAILNWCEAQASLRKSELRPEQP